jgi:DNA polymerase III alpha subunit (gram-positive type)
MNLLKKMKFITPYIINMSKSKKTVKPNIYLSFDVETDGPTPMINNLLSIGIVGLTLNEEIIYRFEANILPLEYHQQDKKTMDFWLKPQQEQSWNHLLTNQRYYMDVFNQLSDELKELTNTYNIHFIAQPACFDWMFLKCYYEQAKLHSTNPDNFYDIGFKCECISTLSEYYKKIDQYNRNIVSNIMQTIKQNNNGTEHQALYDATIQGLFYCKLSKILNELS